MMRKKDILIAIVIFLINFLFFLNFLHIPDLRSWRDEGQFLYGAERLLEGQTIYKDFHEIQYPGSFYIVKWAFQVFGRTFETGRILTYLMVALALSIYYLLLIDCSKNNFLSLLPVITISFFGFPQWAGPVPHWFSFFSNALSLFFINLFLKSKKNIFIIFSGVFSAISLLIVQNEGVFLSAGIVLFLYILLRLQHENLKVIFKRIFIFLIPSIIALTTLVFFFYFKGAINNFFYSTFFFLFEKYISAHKVPSFGYFVEIVSRDLISQLSTIRGFYRVIFTPFAYLVLFLIYILQYGLLVIYPVAIALLARNYFRGKNLDEGFMLKLMFTIIGFFLLLSQIHKPDPIRLMFVSMPGLIILVVLLSSLKGRSLIVINFLAVLIYLTVISYGFLKLYNIHVNYRCHVTAKGGTIYFKNNQVCSEWEQLNSFFFAIPEGQRVVYIHNWAVQYYFWFKLKNPTPVDGLLMGHNSKFQYEISLDILKNSPPLYVITDDVLERLIRFPEESPFPLLDRELLKHDPIWDFIRGNYSVVISFPASGLTLWRRKGL
jgi:hypothetical protein